MKKIFAAIAVGLLGCAALGLRSTVLESHVQSAARRWEAALGIPMRVRAETMVVEISDAYGCKASEPDKRVLGCWDTPLQRMTVDTKCPEELYEKIVLHEFGHALGLEHLTDHPGAATMREFVENQPGCLTTADVDAACSMLPCMRRAPECD